MLGVDKGSTYTKTDKNVCIRSTLRKFRENDVNLDNDRVMIELDGQKFIAGDKGNYSTDLMKSQHFNTKAFVLLAIGLSYPQDEWITTDIVTGLPIGLYSSQKQLMKETFNNTSHDIKINGKKKNIRIRRAEVFPEAAGAFYSQNECEDALVIDFGGLSIDTALFKGKKLKKYSTYSAGMMKLYSKLANKINSEYDLSYTEWDMEDLIRDGLYIYGKKVDLGVDDLAIEHCKEIIERLSLEYDLKSIRNVLLTGGPAKWIEKYFAMDIPQRIVMQQSQFANAIGYRNIGQVIFN